MAGNDAAICVWEVSNVFCVVVVISYESVADIFSSRISSATKQKVIAMSIQNNQRSNKKSLTD